MTYKYGGSDPAYNKFGSMHLLFWKAIQEAKNSRLKVFDFGRTDADQPGLITFKGRWGATQSRLIYSRYVLPGKSPGFLDPAIGNWKDAACQTLLCANAELRCSRSIGDKLYRHIGVKARAKTSEFKILWRRRPQPEIDAARRHLAARDKARSMIEQVDSRSGMWIFASFRARLRPHFLEDMGRRDRVFAAERICVSHSHHSRSGILAYYFLNESRIFQESNSPASDPAWLWFSGGRAFSGSQRA